MLDYAEFRQALHLLRHITTQRRQQQQNAEHLLSSPVSSYTASPRTSALVPDALPYVLQMQNQEQVHVPAMNRREYDAYRNLFLQLTSQHKINGACPIVGTLVRVQNSKR